MRIKSAPLVKMGVSRSTALNGAAAARAEMIATKVAAEKMPFMLNVIEVILMVVLSNCR